MPAHPKARSRSPRTTLHALTLALIVAPLCPATVLAEARFDAAYRSITAHRFSSSLAAGDVDADGRPDLMTAGGSLYSVHRGRGDGSFEVPITTPCDASTFVVGLRDMDGDEVLDAVFLRPNQIQVRLGLGDGGFGSPVSSATVASGSSLFAEIADFDEDGALDVLARNGSSMSLSLGNGDGSFQPPSSISLRSPLATDLDGDGHVDLIGPVSTAIEGFFNGYQFQLGNGDGTFAPPVDLPMALPAGHSTGRCAVGDVNGDGSSDLIGTVVGNAGQVAVMLATGPASFGAPALYATNASPGRVFLADFTGDAAEDIVTVELINGGAGSMSILRGRGDGTFDAAHSRPTGEPVNQQAVPSDLDSDGRPDIVQLNRLYDLCIHLSGAAAFDPDDALSLDDAPAFDGVTAPGAIGDVDGDGHLDVVGGTAGAWLARGTGDGRFEPLEALTTTYTLDVALADVDGDMDLDFVSTGDGAVIVQLGLGDGSFGTGTSWPVSGITHSILAGDLNHDGRADVAVPNAADSTVSILLGRSDGGFETIRVFHLPERPGILHRANLNDDGNPDLVVALASTGAPSGAPPWSDIALLGEMLGDGTGSFTVSTIPLVPAANAFELAVGDVDLDGVSDLVTVSSPDYRVSLGDGNGGFAPVFAQSIASFHRVVSIVDLDGDGVPDLNFLSPGNALFVHAGSGDGGFTTPENGWGVGSLPVKVMYGDLDGDGLLDVVTINYYMDDLRPVLNASGATAGIEGVPAAGPTPRVRFVPNPARGAASVSFTLAGPGPATLEVFDLAGRRLATREVVGLGAGTHRMPLRGGSWLEPGVYLVRVRQGGDVLTGRGVVVD